MAITTASHPPPTHPPTGKNVYPSIVSDGRSCPTSLASHTRSLRSSPPCTIRPDGPSETYLRHVTRLRGTEEDARHAPVSASQVRTLVSRDPEQRVRSSGPEPSQTEQRKAEQVEQSRVRQGRQEKSRAEQTRQSRAGSSRAEKGRAGQSRAEPIQAD